MSRKIPTATKDWAFRLWLQGHAYREIHSRTGMSLGAINQMVAEARAKISSIEELRELNIVLRKGGASVHDAVRGAKLLDVLNERGVGLDTLHSYIELSNRMSSECGVEAERFVDAGMRLVGLEAKIGKSYGDVVKDFEERVKQVEGLAAKAKSVREEIQRLMDRKAKLGDEIRDAEERLSSSRQELNKAVGTNERLKKIGLEKVADLARFINEFESLEFSANGVRELAQLKKELDAEGIHPRSLLQHFKSTRGLKQMRQAIQREVESEETKLKLLASARKDVEKQIRDIQRIHYLMNMRKAFACSHCGSQFFTELTRFQVSQCLATGQPIVLNCHRCGAPNTFNPYEVLAKLGFEVLS
jgi:DNA repair exonuclease SbcCD ATPase subunit